MPEGGTTEIDTTVIHLSPGLQLGWLTDSSTPPRYSVVHPDVTPEPVVVIARPDAPPVPTVVALPASPTNVPTTDTAGELAEDETAGNYAFTLVADDGDVVAPTGTVRGGMVISVKGPI